MDCPTISEIQIQVDPNLAKITVTASKTWQDFASFTSEVQVSALKAACAEL